MLASRVLMVRPDHFGFHAEAGESNAFQSPGATDRVVAEFDGLVAALRVNGICVEVASPCSNSPDSVFPNNWLATFDGGRAVLFPMATALRRQEVDRLLVSDLGYASFTDWTGRAEQGEFLEGTGSLVLDRWNHAAFLCRSPRSKESLAADICSQFSPNYDLVAFDAANREGVPIYHTNVMLSVGENYAVVCTESMPDPSILVDRLVEKQIIEISIEQMNHFCGNILQLNGPILVMSSRAIDAYTDEQKKQLENHGKLVSADLEQIENVGGGSARCMIAELF